MSKDNYQDDLPVLHPDDELPAFLGVSNPVHREASRKVYPAWTTLASQRYVRAIALSKGPSTGSGRGGDLWLATAGGVLRWWPDRRHFTRYGSEHGLPGNSVLAVAVDGSGRVWAAHEQYGLSYLENEHWHAYEMIEQHLEAEALPSADQIWQPFSALSAISCLTVDAAGRLWVAKPQGIYVLEVGAWQIEPTDSHHKETDHDPKPWQAPPLPSGTPPRALAVNESGEIWICQARGVFRGLAGDPGGTNNEWERYLGWPDVLQLALQGENLWLGTLRGLIRVHLPSGEREVLSSNEITALSATSQGVWFASRGRVGRATEGGPPRFLPDFGAGRIAALAPDPSGELWIGGERGLFGGRPDAIEPQLTKQAPDVIGIRAMSNMILTLAVPEKQPTELWIGTSRDLICLDFQTKSWRKYRDLQGVEHLVVSNPDGEIWAASRLEGLFRLSPQRAESERVLAPPLLAFADGAEGTLWAVTSDGLHRRQGVEWPVVWGSRKLRRLNVRLLRAQANRLWLGTSDGLFLCHPDAKEPKAINCVLRQVSVQALLPIPHAEDEVDFLWVGTEQGLYAGKAEELSADKPLARCRVNALAWDAANQLIWVGSERGLLSFTPQGSKRNHFTVRESGLSANRITALALTSATDGKNQLWIGTPCGLSCYIY